MTWNEGFLPGGRFESFLPLVAPRTISGTEWSGVAEDLSARCHHQSPCVKLVAFDSVGSGTKFLACAEKVRPSFVVTNHLLDVIQTLSLCYVILDVKTVSQFVPTI